MTIIFDDSLSREQLYPFTATRNVADIRIGILTIREKWALLQGDERQVSLTVQANLIPTTDNVSAILASLTNDEVLKNDDKIKRISYPWMFFY